MAAGRVAPRRSSEQPAGAFLGGEAPGNDVMNDTRGVSNVMNHTVEALEEEHNRAAQNAWQPRIPQRGASKGRVWRPWTLWEGRRGWRM